MFAVNYLAVLVSVVAYTILGMLWYGPLFGKPWAKLAGLENMDRNDPEVKKSMTSGYVSSLISTIIAMIFLAVFMKAAGVMGAGSGLLYGAGIGFGFVAMTLIGEAAWHNNPAGLVVINSGYRIVGLAVAGLIIGVW